MTTYSVAMQKDSPIMRLYEKLKEDGVKDADLDTGYPQTDYVKKTRQTVHKGDHKIDGTEVLNYALEHYERYQLAIKETTGYIVPWSLDDLNPATDFDAKIRDKVSRAITAFKQILTEKGLKAGTNRYNELLGVSLLGFAWMSPPNHVIMSIRTVVKQELEREGLSEVFGYLERSGGLALAEMGKDCELEATALESLANVCGWCSEKSKILYAVFRAAGLRPKPLDVLLGYEYNDKKKQPGAVHQSVALTLGGKVRIFDAAMKRSDALPYYKENKFIWWWEVTGVEFLADHIMNLGIDYTKRNEPDRAAAELKTSLKLNPSSFKAHAALGFLYSKMGDHDRAISELQLAFKLNPYAADVLALLGTVYWRKEDLDQAIVTLEAAVKLDPYEPDAHCKLGLVYEEKGKLDRTIAELNTAVKLDPKDATVYELLGDAFAKKANQDQKAHRAGPMLKMCKSALDAFRKARELGGVVVSDEMLKQLREKIDYLERAGIR